MNVGVEALFTSALGLVASWELEKVDLDTVQRRIDFEVRCNARTLACPHCGVSDQRIHDRQRRSWRHLDFFQFEAWLHADVPRVACSGCGKTTQVGVPWAREGSGFTELFEALSLPLCRELPVRHAVADLKAHGGEPQQVRHLCMDMSAAYAKDVGLVLPGAQISYDRFHVVKMAIEAMDEVRRAELRERPAALAQLDPHQRRSLMWGMRKNPLDWSTTQLETMHWLKGSNLKSARAWRLKMGLREVYAQVRTSNDAVQAKHDLSGWISWARRCRLEPFKKLAAMLQTHFAAVARGMTDNRSNAFVEAMNGLLQQAKHAACGFRTTRNFIAIAYLRMSRLKHLPVHPVVPASAK